MQTQGVAYYRSQLVNNALGAAMVSAARSQSPIGWLHYLWNSPLTYAWMNHLTDDFEAHAVELIAGVEAVRDFLRDRARWTWSFTGSDQSFARMGNTLSEWAGHMSARTLTDTQSGAQPTHGTGDWDGGRELPPLLGLAAPLDVQFCATAFPAPEREVLPVVDLGFSLLQYDYFMPEIRFKGNAYGGGSCLDPRQRTATMYSYRDPRLNETLQVFKDATSWVQAQSWTPDDLERALLGNVRDAVPAIRPDDATSISLERLRRGETAARRAADYRQKLETTPEAVQSALVDYLTRSQSQAGTAVAASRAALERANAQRREQGAPTLTIEEMLPEDEL